MLQTSWVVCHVLALMSHCEAKVAVFRSLCCRTLCPNLPDLQSSMTPVIPGVGNEPAIFTYLGATTEDVGGVINAASSFKNDSEIPSQPVAWQWPRCSSARKPMRTNRRRDGHRMTRTYPISSKCSLHACLRNCYHLLTSTRSFQGDRIQSVTSSW